MLREYVLNHEPFVQKLAQASAALGGDSYVIADAKRETVWPLLPEYRDVLKTSPASDGDQSTFAWRSAPIYAGSDYLVGFVGLQASDTPTARDILALQTAILGQVLTRERELNDMATELMSTYDQLVAMYHVSEITRSNLNLEEILQSLLAEAMQLSKAKHGFLALQQESGLRILTHAWSSSRHAEIAQLLFQNVQEREHALVCNTPANLHELLLDVPASAERCLVVPVATQSKVIAALGLLDKADYFTAGDRKLLTALADEAGGIIERARLQAQLVSQERMRRELEIAAEIQTGLLPLILPHVSGLDLAARSKPANEVGGDFYDFIVSPGGPMMVVLGDVTGKGVPAALFVTVAHTILHSNVGFAETPLMLLEQLNAAMYDGLTQSAMFVTLFIAYYDVATRRLMTVNAGHSPVLFYEARTGRCHLWEADGPPVGVLPDMMNALRSITLAPGDVLAIMSDGFNEMTNPDGEMFGIERLEQLLEREAGHSAGEIRDCFFQVVADFAHATPPADDLTICILKAVPYRVVKGGGYDRT